jgi:hypothetical protein
MGYSNNPGGRRKYDKGAKEHMGKVTPEVVEFWIATMRDKTEEMSHRMRASENIAWGFLGEPSQQVFAAHAHVNLNDLPQGADELDRLATGYAAMLGAVDEPGPMIDVTPSRSRALPEPRVSIEELRRIADEEIAEQEAAQRPPQRERIRRPRPVMPR